MAERTSKDLLLKNVRKSSLQKEGFFISNPDFDSDVFTKKEGTLAEIFAKEFTSNKGKFIYCYHEYHFLDILLKAIEKFNWQNIVCGHPALKELLMSCNISTTSGLDEIQKADVGLISCEALAARTGSVVVSSKTNMGRSIGIFPPVCIVVAYKDQIVYDLRDYFSTINQSESMPSAISIIGGPSRTSDIERKLVIGMHGATEIYVFYIDQNKNY
ncbi:MAG: LUD domain-containing protein [Bacteroidetes bacterium]|nr:LUD domain-containing protein [Bacteroidota bacterium]